MTKEELMALLKERNKEQVENGFCTIYDSSFDHMDEVMELIYSTLPHSIEDPHSQAIEDFEFYHKQPHRLLAYLQHNQLVGLIGYAKTKEEGTYSIIPLIVHEQFRNKGYAQLLLSYVEGLLLSLGVKKMHAVVVVSLHIEPSNTAEVIPFLRNGFSITYKEKLIDDELQVISLEKSLIPQKSFIQ